jgi:hypothetical protein
MNSVDRVKAICKERNIPISKLEKDLGFAVEFFHKPAITIRNLNVIGIDVFF